MDRNSGAPRERLPAIPPRTRERLFAVLREHPGGLTVAQLGALLALKPNAMRNHLAAPSGLGSVAADRSPPRGGGRSPARFRLAGDDKTGHADRMLSRPLLQALGGIRASEAERSVLNSKPARYSGASLDDTLSSLGFACLDISSRSQRGAGHRTIELRACP
jgi:predicted ArsR family transcriptional regulator